MAVKYLKDISKEMTEFAGFCAMAELAAVLMLKDKQARADQTKVKLSLGNNLEKVCENPSESVAKIVGIFMN